MEKLVTVLVPAKFWWDHYNRDLDDTSRVVKGSGHRVLLEMNPAAIAELASDADYYATGFTGEDAADLRGLIASAKATLKALKKQGF